MLIEVQSPDTVALQRDADSRAGFARDLTIDSASMFEIAGDELREIKAKIKDLNERRVAITKPIDEAKKRVMELFAAPLSRLAEAESALKAAMLAWDEKIRREQEIAARAAEAAAAAHRARLEAEARAADELARVERERLNAEAAKLEAESNQAAQAPADDAATWVAAQDDAVAKATQAEALRQAAAQTGAHAEALRVEAATTVAYVPTVAAPKAAGISSRVSWDAEVTSLLELVRFVGAHPEYINLLMVDSVVLRSLARAQKDALTLPGVRAIPKRGISARS